MAPGEALIATLPRRRRTHLSRLIGIKRLLCKEFTVPRGARCRAPRWHCYTRIRPEGVHLFWQLFGGSGIKAPGAHRRAVPAGAVVIGICIFGFLLTALTPEA